MSHHPTQNNCKTQGDRLAVFPPVWHDIHNYHEGRLDGGDPLAVAMYAACVDELARQHGTQESAV